MEFKLSWPNRITVLRILLIPGFVLALMQTREGEAGFRWVALVLLALVALGDGLDGYLARRLKSRSKLGAFLDPLADKLLMTSGYVVMASMLWPEPRMPKWVSVVVISRDVMIALFYFSMTALGSNLRMITPSFIGKTCATLQMVTLVAVLAAPASAGLLSEDALVTALNALFLITAFLTLVSGIDYLYAARVSLDRPEGVALIETDAPDAGKENDE
jgi:cardiolipin synthase